MQDSNIESSQEMLRELLSALGIPDATIEIDQLDDQPMLSIHTDDHSLLIGRRGENLYALQILFNAMRRKAGLDNTLTVDVGGYRKDHVEKLMRIAEDAAQKVITYGQDFELKPMTAYERRVVHMVLADKPELSTESVGEGRDRRIIIKRLGA